MADQQCPNCARTGRLCVTCILKQAPNVQQRVFMLHLEALLGNYQAFQCLLLRAHWEHVIVNRDYYEQIRVAVDHFRSTKDGWSKAQHVPTWDEMKAQEQQHHQLMSQARQQLNAEEQPPVQHDQSAVAMPAALVQQQWNTVGRQPFGARHFPDRSTVSQNPQQRRADAPAAQPRQYSTRMPNLPAADERADRILLTLGFDKHDQRKLMKGMLTRTMSTLDRFLANSGLLEEMQAEKYNYRDDRPKKEERDIRYGYLRSNGMPSALHPENFEHSILTIDIEALSQLVYHPRKSMIPYLFNFVSPDANGANLLYAGRVAIFTDEMLVMMKEEQDFRSMDRRKQQIMVNYVRLYFGALLGHHGCHKQLADAPHEDSAFFHEAIVNLGPTLNVQDKIDRIRHAMEIGLEKVAGKPVEQLVVNPHDAVENVLTQLQKLKDKYEPQGGQQQQVAQNQPQHQPVFNLNPQGNAAQLQGIIPAGENAAMDEVEDSSGG
ncbi:uncharacterized protein LOC129598553 isoform X1 [Paramacrobiotus metropolitanus]|uniref:uncharacterized protein LOC129598553 isoform X1 n=1 Tax=Paramacrobiotus metropolitanus TaxID=2943436 RepID=UPI0024458A74|nr:uncharacterized protein LOC129598553 isoform X1 [Paramacrobiotus metropolitanus]